MYSKFAGSNIYIYKYKSGKVGWWYRNCRFFCAAIWVPLLVLGAIFGLYAELFVDSTLPLKQWIYPVVSLIPQLQDASFQWGVKNSFVHHPEALESHQCLATTSDLNLSVPNMVTFLMAKPSSSSKTPTKHIQNFGYETQQKSTWNLKMPKFKTNIIIQTSIFGVQHVKFSRVYPKNLHLEVPCPPPHQGSQVSTAKWMHHAKHMDEIPRSIQGKARLLGIGIHFHTLWPWPAHRPRSHRCRYKTHMYVSIIIWLYVIANGYGGYIYNIHKHNNINVSYTELFAQLYTWTSWILRKGLPVGQPFQNRHPSECRNWMKLTNFELPK